MGQRLVKRRHRARTARALCVAAEPSRDPAKAVAGVYELDPRQAGLEVRVPYLGFSSSTRL